MGLDKFMDQARGSASLKDLSRDRKHRVLSRKEALYFEGDELRNIFMIERGKVRTFKINNDGKELVTGLHGPGDFIGYMSVVEGGRSHENAETMEETELALVPREDVLALLFRDRDVSMRFIKMLSREVKEKEERLLDLAYASVRQRVAGSILRLRDRYGDGSKAAMGVKISREDLATIVGTATESLIRTLSDLRDEGLIELQGRDIHIRDAAKLERLAVN